MVHPMSGIRRRRGFNLKPALAHRGVDCAVLCGACDHVVASRRRDMLVFVEPNLQRLIERLPATVECPFCRVPNLLDPKRLNVSEQQVALRLPHSAIGPAIGLQIF